MFGHCCKGFQTWVAGVIFTRTVSATTIKCGVSWDPYLMTFHVLVFFIDCWSIQKEWSQNFHVWTLGRLPNTSCRGNHYPSVVAPTMKYGVSWELQVTSFCYCLGSHHQIRCKLGPLCNGISCVSVFHRFLEQKKNDHKILCLDIGREGLQTQVAGAIITRLSRLPPSNVCKLGLWWMAFHV